MADNQSRDGVIVYAYVVGDLLHSGHRTTLKQAKDMGDYLIVGVLTDEATMTYKRKPVIPLKERMAGIRDLRYVDEVVVQEKLDPTDNLKELGCVDIVVHGTDWGKDFPGAEYMRSIGKKARRTKFNPELPTTTQIIVNIIQRYRNGSLP